MYRKVGSITLFNLSGPNKKKKVYWLSKASCLFSPHVDKKQLWPQTLRSMAGTTKELTAPRPPYSQNSAVKRLEGSVPSFFRVSFMGPHIQASAEVLS